MTTTSDVVPSISSPETPARQREVVRHEAILRTLTVQSATDITAHIKRITLVGDELSGFASVGPEDHVKVLFPAPPGVRIMRDYTPAAFRPATEQAGAELDIDFVVHTDGGPASAWAASAAPGDLLQVGGPRGSRKAPHGYARYLLLADESSIPAMARWISAVAHEAPVTAFVQSTDPGVLDYLGDLPAGVEASRIDPGSDAALAAFASVSPDSDSYVWAAGEASALVPVRRSLRSLGLDKNQAKVDGYWRIGVAELDHHAPLDPENPED